MRCIECDGWMRPERDEIATHRGIKVEEWVQCEDCGHVSDVREDVSMAREDELERWDLDGLI